VAAAAARLQRGGGLAALPLYALSATEQGLLDRMRRLMLLVTLAALIAGALSAYGTLTDLALERRREIALLKSLGAPRRRIIGRFLAESVAIGLSGVCGLDDRGGVRAVHRAAGVPRLAAPARRRAARGDRAGRAHRAGRGGRAHPAGARRGTGAARCGRTDERDAGAAGGGLAPTTRRSRHWTAWTSPSRAASGWR
jgi:hypothetical protein